MNSHIFSKKFWSGKSASQALEEGTMSKQLKFTYYLVSTFVLAVFFEVYYWSGVSDSGLVNNYDMWLSLVSVVITLLATVYIYKKYEGSASFIEKMIIVSIASAPRLLLLTFVPVLLILMILLEVLYEEVPLATTPIDFAAIIISELLYWYLLAQYFTSQKMQQPN